MRNLFEYDRQMRDMGADLDPERETLFPNPRAYKVSVGQTVTCIYSQRKIVVARVATHGNVYEELPGERFNFIGSYYEEFEPAFVSADRLELQLAQATCQ